MPRIAKFLLACAICLTVGIAVILVVEMVSV